MRISIAFFILLYTCWISQVAAEGLWREQMAKKSAQVKGYEELNLEQYTGERMREKFVAVNHGAGTAKIVRMFEQRTLASFTAGERAFEWARRQLGNPEAIVIENGCLSVDEVFQAINNPDYITAPAEKTYLLKVPIAIERGACLLVDGESVDEVRLSLEGGVFISNAGDLFTFGSKIVGWTEQGNKPSAFVNPHAFRPFIVAWDGSDVYFYRTHFQSLGYENSKSYGISLSKFTEAAIKHMPADLHPPTGWIVESTFEDLYFGFYCYESEGVVIHKNLYKNNIIYGIDPHDRSRKLIISHNEVYGTRKKHGIIMSREVNDSWIVGNYSHHNHLSGIVLDRACEGNLIADNRITENGADGISFYESGHNTLLRNKAFANHHHGARLRNSEGVTLVDNEFIANRRLGLFLLAEDLAGTDRDFKLDPYSTRISVDLEGGVFAANESGPIKISEPEKFRLHNVQFRFPVKSRNMILPGFLKTKTLDVFRVANDSSLELIYEKYPVRAAVD